MKSGIAKKIIHETEKGYDLISGKFSQTRRKFWAELAFLKSYTHQGDRIFDFGCGNGRLLELIRDIPEVEYHGTDISQELVDTAKGSYPWEWIHFSKMKSDQDTLPFEDGYFNTTYSIAVFHHLPSADYRENVARELFRIIKPGGHVVVTVWNLWQRKYFGNVARNWLNKLVGKSDLDWNDCMISFTDNEGRVFQRFHHAFTKRELGKIFAKAGFEIERCEVVMERNILLIGKKPQME